jgi:aspartyl-tRNA synthetase
MKRTLVLDTMSRVGEQVSVSGWVHSRRNHGGLVFIDIRDHTGILQLVINPDHAEAFAIADELRDEFVIKATGYINERTADLKNDKISTGSVELSSIH